MSADDKFRSNFLWGRKPMLAACAARLAEKRDLIWVDLGGGTGVGATDPPGSDTTPWIDRNREQVLACYPSPSKVVSVLRQSR